MSITPLLFSMQRGALVGEPGATSHVADELSGCGGLRSCQPEVHAAATGPELSHGSSTTSAFASRLQPAIAAQLLAPPPMVAAGDSVPASVSKLKCCSVAAASQGCSTSRLAGEKAATAAAAIAGADAPTTIAARCNIPHQTALRFCLGALPARRSAREAPACRAARLRSSRPQCSPPAAGSDGRTAFRTADIRPSARSRCAACRKHRAQTGRVRP